MIDLSARREAVNEELEVLEYVAGHFDPERAVEFEARMAADPQLRRRVEEERNFADLLTRDQAVLTELAPDSDAAAMERFWAAAEHQPKRLHRNAWGGALAAGIAAGIAALALVTLWVPGQRSPEYETLSSERVREIPGAYRVRVIFAQDVSAAERARLEERYGFRIVSGPGAAESYVVSVESAASRERLQTWLRDPRIAFAEPLRYESVP